MRALGYSKRQAAAIAARGFKALDLEADPAEDSSDDLERLTAALRGTVNT
jgi:hypothetical protein